MIRACAPVLAFLVSGGVLYAQADASFPKRVSEAIDRGVAWLKQRQIKQGADKGSWGTGDSPVYGGGGTTQIRKIAPCAIALFTLLSCDVDPDDPVITDGFKYLKDNLDHAWKPDNVNIDQAKQQADCYTASMILLAVEALHIAKINQALRKAGKDPKTLKQRPPIKLEKEYKQWVAQATKWLVSKQSKRGGWRYGEPLFPSPAGIQQDISATQIVLLGLSAAVRMGEKISPDVWTKAAQYNIDMQEKDGPPVQILPADAGEGKTVLMREGDKARGWAYTPGEKNPDRQHDLQVSGSMTASGICSLIICTAELAKSAPKKDLVEKMRRGIFDGLAWLQTHWSVSHNPGGHRSHYYYLYGLERVGVLGSMEKIGTHDWYLEGAEFLLDAQKRDEKDKTVDGMWDSRTEIQPSDVFDTCFALLFLKKATIPVTIISR